VDRKLYTIKQKASPNLYIGIHISVAQRHVAHSRAVPEKKDFLFLILEWGLFRVIEWGLLRVV
jgi:hypothetical protein